MKTQESSSSSVVVSRTFDVVNVPANQKRRTTASNLSVWQTMLQTPVEACYEPGSEICEPYGFHSLMETAHTAYANHYGLELTPDIIWLTVVQGFAKIVNNSPEEFRDKFVSHEGKQKIRIVRDEFVLGDPNNNWQGCFPEFSQSIRSSIGDKTHALLLCDFTTTGAIERTASEIALMDTVQNYFEYEVNTRCGIPFITLYGGADDWRKLRRKVRDLCVFGDLQWWLEPLNEIFDEFIAAAEGHQNELFWSGLYKDNRGSGFTSITGWLVKLIPYIKSYSNWKKNPMLASNQGYVFTSDLPSSLSTVPFIWNYLGNEFAYEFAAGVIGYTQNEESLALKPEMGWAVRQAT